MFLETKQFSKFDQFHPTKVYLNQVGTRFIVIIIIIVIIFQQKNQYILMKKEQDLENKKQVFVVYKEPLQVWAWKFHHLFCTQFAHAIIISDCLFCIAIVGHVILKIIIPLVSEYSQEARPEFLPHVEIIGQILVVYIVCPLFILHLYLNEEQIMISNFARKIYHQGLLGFKRAQYLSIIYHEDVKSMTKNTIQKCSPFPQHLSNHIYDYMNFKVVKLKPFNRQIRGLLFWFLCTAIFIFEILFIISLGSFIQHLLRPNLEEVYYEGEKSVCLVVNAFKVCAVLVQNS
jgi:hypothetical protein